MSLYEIIFAERIITRRRSRGTVHTLSNVVRVLFVAIIAIYFLGEVLIHATPAMDAELAIQGGK